MNQRILFIAACAACAVALGGGFLLIVLLVVFRDSGLSVWLVRLELAALCSAALAYGFAASLPMLAPWLWSRPVKGTACVFLGVAAIFVPMQFVVAAFFIAVGTRLVWVSACELEAGDARTTDLMVVTPAAEIVPRAPAASVTRRGER